MKPTENYEQLIQRFTKRTTQLSARLAEVKEPYEEYLRIQKDLTRLEGSLQAIEYLASVSYTHLTLPTIYSV